MTRNRITKLLSLKLATAVDRTGKPTGRLALQSARIEGARPNDLGTCCSREKWGVLTHLRLAAAPSFCGHAEDCKSGQRHQKPSSSRDRIRHHEFDDTGN